MTEAQIILIKKSWRAFQGIDPKIVGDLFYSKLFTDNSNIRKMFPRHMDEQYQKLVDMLSTIVARLDRIEELNDDIAAMARRHVDYGVRPGHYKLVGNALLWTLKKGLGADWTKETEEAWIQCYNLLAETMINASGYKEKDHV